MSIDYKAFLVEALKITFFCLIATALFKFFDASNTTLLIVFNMAVMFAAATFSPEKNRLKHVTLGSGTVVLSIVIGGVLGYYFPLLAQIVLIVYASLAFLLSKTKATAAIFVTGAVMFLIFASLSFDWQNGFHYLFDGLIVMALFIGFHWFFESQIHTNREYAPEPFAENQKILAMIAGFALLITCLISHVLQTYTSLTHLYWIGLTTLLVIQGSQQKTIQTSLKRIGVNAIGALIAVLLFSYIIPPIFWINFAVLTLFLFLIFALGFSYIGRVLFIELFVLGFTHLLGDYQAFIALDRVILTLTGGLIVIFATLIIYAVSVINIRRR